MGFLNRTDAYVNRIFWKIFFTTTAAFLFINIIIDLFDRLKMFLDNEAPFYLYFYYYLIKSPYLLNYMIPVVTIFATIVTLHKLIKNNEILIFFNAGLSYLRIAAPLIAAGLLISIFSFFLSELVVPPCNYMIDKTEATIKKRPFVRTGDKSDFSYRGKNGFVYSIRSYNHETRTVSDLLIEKWEGNAIRYRADIREAVFTDGKWLCKDVYIKLFDENKKELPVLIDQPVKGLYLEVSETPADFSKNVKKPDEMNFLELRRFIREKQRAGLDVTRSRVEYQMKFSFPLVSFLVTLLGLGITISKPRMALSSIIGFSLGISFLFWGVFATSRSLGTSGRLSPFASAWIPDILMVILSLSLILVKQRGTFK
ncbi:MAG TPA: LptF/LptG family permease [Candidatus Mcinerneyibacteriales bacterium]|nr:LptF/LptG family permease [Candidatus Mcinerneyibacteriales bacterium]HPJ70161.1 LptF/LptG family permease [Candidatus Mcinerneyibacteriales bacterium]